MNEAIRERVGAYLMGNRESKSSIANRLGVTLNTLNAKLRGESDFSLSQAFELADMLGCSVDDLRRRPT